MDLLASLGVLASVLNVSRAVFFSINLVFASTPSHHASSNWLKMSLGSTISNRSGSCSSTGYASSPLVSSAPGYCTGASPLRYLRGVGFRSTSEYIFSSSSSCDFFNLSVGMAACPTHLYTST